MSELTTLKPASTKPNSKVIEALEKSLERARDGRLREVLIVGNHVGGDFYHIATFDNGPELLGYLQLQTMILGKTLLDE